MCRRRVIWFYSKTTRRVMKESSFPIWIYSLPMRIPRTICPVISPRSKTIALMPLSTPKSSRIYLLRGIPSRRKNKRKRRKTRNRTRIKRTRNKRRRRMSKSKSNLLTLRNIWRFSWMISISTLPSESMAQKYDKKKPQNASLEPLWKPELMVDGSRNWRKPNKELLFSRNIWPIVAAFKNGFAKEFLQEYK